MSRTELTFLTAMRESRAIVGLPASTISASLHYAIREYAVASYGLAELLTNLALLLIAGWQAHSHREP